MSATILNPSSAIANCSRHNYDIHSIYRPNRCPSSEYPSTSVTHRSASMGRRWKAGLPHIGRWPCGDRCAVALGAQRWGQSASVPADPDNKHQSRRSLSLPGRIHLEARASSSTSARQAWATSMALSVESSKGRFYLGAEQNAGHIVFRYGELSGRYERLVNTSDSAARPTLRRSRKSTPICEGSAVLDIQQYPDSLVRHRIVAVAPRQKQTRISAVSPRRQIYSPRRHSAVSIIADAEPKGGWIHLRGSFAILQTTYGITPFSKAFGAIGITDQLNIWGDIWIAGPKGMHGGQRYPSKGIAKERSLAEGLTNTSATDCTP